MTVDPDIILNISGVSKSFPGVKALSSVDFKLRRGRLTAILGENGAGKSTLMKIIAGADQADEGLYEYLGKPVSFTNTGEAMDRGIVMIHQELNLVQELTVAENIFLGREPRNPLGWIDYKKMNANAQSILDRLEFDGRPDQAVELLRVGQQQIVEIAKALSFDAKVVIMDEPTSAITDHEVEVLFRIIADLKNQGVAISYITHKMDELESIADDFVVMRDGKTVGYGQLTDYTDEERIEMMVGRNLDSFFVKSEHSFDPTVYFEVKNLSLDHPAKASAFLVNNVSWKVSPGEVLGVFGLMGAGRTEMLETLYGLHPKSSRFELFFRGKAIPVRHPCNAISNGIVLAPEDRKHDGLVLEMSVAQNMTLPTLSGLSSWGVVSERKENTFVNDGVDRFNVKTSSAHEQITNLSGGNQQKVILAKWLGTAPKLMLFDEPTRGIDIGAKHEIYELINEMAKNGLAVLLVSSELPEIMALSDRIMVLSEGQKTAEFTRDQFSENKILEAALPRKSHK